MNTKDHPNTEAEEQPDGTEFERFREFAREIVNVPKSEIDRRAAEYEEQPKPIGRNPFKNKIIPAR